MSHQQSTESSLQLVLIPVSKWIVMCRMAKPGRLSNSGLPEYDQGLDMILAHFNNKEKELEASV